MADILFIMPRFSGLNGEPLSENNGPPLPFLWLAAILEPKGYSIRIIDAGLYVNAKELIAAELKNKPLFAGFYGHVGRTVRSLIELSSFVKETAPDIPVIHGGVLPSMNPELTLREPFVDIVVIGEGEETVLELADALKEKKSIDDIKGIGYKKNGKMVITPERPLLDMGTLPLPAWHHIKSDIDKYLLPVGYKKDGTSFQGLHIVSSKGCPAKCSFCFSKFYQKRFRFKSAAQTLDEIEYLMNNFNIRYFYYHDEDFLVHKRRTREFLQGIRDRKLDIKFSCQARVDSVDENLLEEASRLGLVQVSFGVEFCKEDVLESYKKSISLEQVFKVAEICRKYNIFSHFNLICGYPGETHADMMTTVKVAGKLRSINPFSEFSLYIYTPNYGTPEFEELERKYNFYPKKLADCECLHWSSVENRKWMKYPSLCRNFVYMFTIYFKFASDITPALYKSGLIRKWAYLRLKGPFLRFAPEMAVFNFIRRIFRLRV